MLCVAMGATATLGGYMPACPPLADVTFFRAFTQAAIVFKITLSKALKFVTLM